MAGWTRHEYKLIIDIEKIEASWFIEIANSQRVYAKSDANADVDADVDADADADADVDVDVEADIRIDFDIFDGFNRWIWYILFGNIQFICVIISNSRKSINSTTTKRKIFDRNVANLWKLLSRSLSILDVHMID